MKPLLLGLLGAAALLAQSHGYAFLAPGVASGGSDASLALFHAGIGGEGVLRNGFGVGGDVGVIGRTDLGGLAALSLNGVYQFHPQSRTVPYVTAGYSSFFNFGGSLNLANLGGGANIWFRQHLGMKLELRDHFRAGEVNYLEFRVGATFR